jgi:hypothetical protein
VPAAPYRPEHEKGDFHVPIFITQLVQSGLRLLANAALVKGKDFIKDKTGIDVDKASLSPEDVAKLKEFEATHEEELLRIQLEENKLGLEETKAVLEDVADARKNQTAIQTSADAPWYAKAIQPWLAAFTVLITMLLFALFVYWGGGEPLLDAQGRVITDSAHQPVLVSHMTPMQKDIVIYILGVLSAIVTQIFSYYFGSSKGSEAKTETLNQVLNRTVDGAAQPGSGR